MERANECPVTYQDILDLPETQVGDQPEGRRTPQSGGPERGEELAKGQQIINGRLVTHPRLTAKAHFATAQLGGVLGHHFGHPSSTRPNSEGGQQG